MDPHTPGPRHNQLIVTGKARPPTLALRPSAQEKEGRYGAKWCILALKEVGGGKRKDPLGRVVLDLAEFAHATGGQAQHSFEIACAPDVAAAAGPLPPRMLITLGWAAEDLQGTPASRPLPHAGGSGTCISNAWAAIHCSFHTAGICAGLHRSDLHGPRSTPELSEAFVSRCQFKDEAGKAFSFPNLSVAGGSSATSAGVTRSSSYNGDGAAAILRWGSTVQHLFRPRHNMPAFVCSGDPCAASKPSAKLFFAISQCTTRSGSERHWFQKAVCKPLSTICSVEFVQLDAFVRLCRSARSRAGLSWRQLRGAGCGGGGPRAAVLGGPDRPRAGDGRRARAPGQDEAGECRALDGRMCFL